MVPHLGGAKSPERKASFGVEALPDLVTSDGIRDCFATRWVVELSDSSASGSEVEKQVRVTPS